MAGGVTYEFAGGTDCFLYPTPNAGTSAASHAFWQVADVEREVAELKAKGVTFEEYDMPGMKDGIATAGGAKAAWFKDTEGSRGWRTPRSTTRPSRTTARSSCFGPFAKARRRDERKTDKPGLKKRRVAETERLTE